MKSRILPPKLVLFLRQMRRFGFVLYFFHILNIRFSQFDVLPKVVFLAKNI